MVSGPDFRRNFPQDLRKIGRELIAVHNEVRDPNRCRGECCYICKILDCMELLYQHAAAEPPDKDYYKEKILLDPLYYANGIGSGVRLAFIAQHIDWRQDDELKGIFVECEMFNPRDPASIDTPNLDTLHEYFTEALLTQVGCGDIHRPPHGNDRVIDFRFVADGYRFAAECKRMKAESALRRAPAKARKQLRDDSEVRAETAHRLMILDGTHYIASNIFKVHGNSFPKGDAMLLLWGEIEGAQKKIEEDLLHRYARHKEPSVFCNTILMADVPWFSEGLTHETYPVMCPIGDGSEKSDPVIDCLYKRLLRYRGYTGSTEETPRIEVQPARLWVPASIIFRGPHA